MSNSNPAFSRSAVFTEDRYAAPSATELDEIYGRPAATAAETGRMSYEDTIMKTLITFGVLLAGALVERHDARIRLAADDEDQELVFDQQRWRDSRERLQSGLDGGDGNERVNKGIDRVLRCTGAELLLPAPTVK